MRASRTPTEWTIETFAEQVLDAIGALDSDVIWNIDPDDIERWLESYWPLPHEVMLGVSAWARAYVELALGIPPEGGAGAS